ncbi:MAG: ABC transporter ATP-binding protein [Acidobacteriota bacterium]
MEGRSRRQLSVELPGGPAARWIVKIVRLAWIPFLLAIAGRWLGSGFDVLSSSLLAFSVVQLGGQGETGLPIPDALMGWIRASESPLTSALLLALGITLLGRLFQTLVEWCLTWTHLLVNRKLTPEVMEASLEPATHRLLDPSTVVQRWLLKVDISYFIHQSVAQTIGDIGTVLIILVVTFKANLTAGKVALGGLVLWVATAVPLIVYALRASRRSAQAHENVGRIIRDGSALRAELGRPSLRAYWRRRHLMPTKELQTAIKWQGIWNAGLFGFLGLISFAMPIVAVIASSATGSAGSALAVLLYLTRMSGPLESLATTLPWVQQNLISVQRLFQVVETDRDRVDGSPEPYTPSEIQVRDWSVSLPDGSQIHYPDQTARRGTIHLVVGPSGSGKSSLLASLAGQLTATGSLLVDGSDVLPSDPRWRETCAYVPQEPELVPGGLMDNLHDFPGWKETPALVHAVAEVLASRSLGSEGEVAIDEKGVSVGQRRAISVLRAVGSSTAVLLLDEPVAGVGDALVGPIREALLEANGRGTLIVMTAHQHDLERLGLGSTGSVLQLIAN